KPQAHVACFDAVNGRMRWRRLVASSESPASSRSVDEVTHNLLTLHRDTLYYSTNLGAVAALETRDGHLKWITMYPRAALGSLGRSARHFYRDLAPCICLQGQLLVAPSDCQRLFSLDAETGHLLWTTSAELDDVVHLLGVSG